MKRVMCVAISLLFIITIGINTTGYNAEQSVYTTENGEKVYYHLDTDGNPYIIDESGNQIYLTLPLSHLEVTDPAIIVSLEAGRSAVECKAQSRSTPVVGFDLSNCAADAPSRKYTVTVSVPSVATTFITPVFKFNTAHEAVRIKTSDESPWCAGHKINFNYFYYSPATDRWYALSLQEKNCSGINGFGFQNDASTFPYGQFHIWKSSTSLTSFKLEIWTTHIW